MWTVGKEIRGGDQMGVVCLDESKGRGAPLRGNVSLHLIDPSWPSGVRCFWLGLMGFHSASYSHWFYTIKPTSKKNIYVQITFKLCRHLKDSKLTPIYLNHQPKIKVSPSWEIHRCSNYSSTPPDWNGVNTCFKG